MKKKIIIIFTFFLWPSLAVADFSLTKWPYYKEINVATSGLTRFTIDEQMFLRTERDLRDIRIVNSKNLETPFKLLLGKTQSEVKKYWPRMINNSYTPNQHTSVILDFGVNPATVNRLTIQTNNENFQRNVNVYGSNDKVNWAVLTDSAYIYDYTDRRGNVKSQNTSVNFGNSIFRYLRIEVADQDNTPVKINTVYGQEYIPARTKEMKRPVKFSVKATINSTEIYLDQETSGMPTNKLELATADTNFNRGVSIYSSYNNQNWHQIGSGNIFRYQTAKFRGEKLLLEFKETDERYLRVVINNQDNQALNITGANTYATFREVVFTAEANEDYQVYYGNSDARFPRYDLDTYFQYLDLNSIVDATLSVEQNNPSFTRPAPVTPTTPWSETTPYLITIALIISAFVLLVLVYRFFKK